MTTEVPATIRVVGSATSSATPDCVILRLGVDHTAASAPEALDASAATGRALVSAVREAGVADHDVQTSDLSLDRDWDPEMKAPTRYVARHRFTVRAPLDLSGAVIAAAGSAAGDDFRVDSISLAIDDPDPLRARAQRDAFDDARTQATELARLAGRQLGPVISLDTAPESGLSPLQPKGIRMVEMASSGPGIEGGRSAVSATVVVVYQLM